ncbi:unnamed protein product [Danaus chrysippus]|uniref:(African queen) hypothetical protein n=1 Tax=Danaus chrysippus TaxID=151541 RepID=A0A8J2VZM3_9NEOP|nr:unnamed protein product [Danaus chrysippus]
MVRTKKANKEARKTHKDKEEHVLNSIQKGDVEIMPPLEDIENESKKQMNAFKLLMDSRNKVIGSNSPGKFKSPTSIELDEITSQREIKAKRILSLDKMAEAKGSLKKKEIEEYRDRFVVQKMLKRAERLKNMIKSPEKEKTVPTTQTKTVNNLSQNKTNEKEKKNVLEKSKKTLQLCDLFNEPTVKVTHGSGHNNIAQEDIEFLNKLSPSIKKRENMLSYFKKVTKDSDSSLEMSDKNSPVDNKNVIKVKFTPKRKKKSKRLKSPETVSNSDNLTNGLDETKDSNKVQVENSESRKRKRNIDKTESKEDSSTIIQTNVVDCSDNDNRPKRNIKKPIKYTDDIDLFSSDEELHIFTPKKKKNIGKLPLNSSEDKKPKNDIILCDVQKKDVLPLKKDKTKSSKSSRKQDGSQNVSKDRKLDKKVKLSTENCLKNVKIDSKPTKLAPIFVAKPQLSPAAIEAKQNFLKSGVPEKLKKHAQSQPNVIFTEYFQPVVHVQQIPKCTKIIDNKFDFYTTNLIDGHIPVVGDCLLKSFLENVPSNTLNVPNVRHKPIKLLKCLKNAHPKFPVYRTYHLLKGKSKGEVKDCSYPEMDNSIEVIDGLVDISNDNPDKLNWCEKYKPLSSKQILGNFETIKELKRWLETWTESLIRCKNLKSNDSDSSDFYHSDTDTKDGPKNINNLLILNGITGSGKTSSVYAVAAELAIKVIEVNASRKRTGKIMLQDLQEATQSHKVNRGKTAIESSQKSQEIVVTVKKRGRPKRVLDDTKSSSQSSENTTQTSQSQETYTDMSLILIDDADIVFDQDDGFCSALSQLIQSSKRPVILVTSSLTCPHLQKFMMNGKILHMQPFLPRILGTWLDIMCLADVGFCFGGLGARILDFYKGDIRKTINCLQFYMNSNKHVHVDEVALAQIKTNIDDENSSMSWADLEVSEDISRCDENTQMYIDKQVEMLGNKNIDPFNFWWSLPKYYKTDNNLTKTTTSECLEDVSKILDAISISDIFDQNDQTEKQCHLVSNFWLCRENPSVLENESFNDYNKSHYFLNEITQELMNITTFKAQKILNSDRRLCITQPNMMVER